MKKYELLKDKTKVVDGATLYRIRALRDFGGVKAGVKAGEIGGWIESEENLSHEGDCWVHDDAMVFGNAWVFGEAVIGGNSLIGSWE